MTEEQLSHLENGVITRASEDADGGLVLSVTTEHGYYVVEAKACRCGEPCDLTHIHLTKISGYDGQ